VIDLGALRKNVDVVSACVGPQVGVMAVVKADAYGHGAVPVARAIERKVWGFGVSLVEEGIELRRGGIEAPVVVLGSFYGWSHRDVIAYRLTPVIGDRSDVEKFARAAEELTPGKKIGVHVKIDTGMSRLGVRPEKIRDLVASLGAVEVTGVCTHLGDADGEDPIPSESQLREFQRARGALAAAGIRPLVTHAANSAGTLRFAAARGELVRPGLALYGYNASAHAAYSGLTPAMQLQSKIVALRSVPAGTRVSYGSRFSAGRQSLIATVPIGYADGYSRRMSGKAEVLVGGKRCQVAGAITMDMLMVDVTDAGCSVGDDVVLMGAQGGERITADELARWGDTISWEIFTAISKRVPRVYVGDRA
jgi:alanine racemase